MLKQVRRGLEIYRNRGLVSLIKLYVQHVRAKYLAKLYPKTLYAHTIRPYTNISQERKIDINGVGYHPDRTLDPYLPWDFKPDMPSEYEAGTVSALKRYVEPGDDIVIVGGGRGITSVIAAQMTGSEGSVTVYEGVSYLVNQIYDTVGVNSVSNRVNVQHAIVGSRKRLDGPSGNAPTVSADKLSDCDVLELDCEGSETDILPVLEIRPRMIIVESHGNRDKISSQLNSLGYEILDERPAETRLPFEKIEEWGLYTIVAAYSGE